MDTFSKLITIYSFILNNSYRVASCYFISLPGWQRHNNVLLKFGYNIQYHCGILSCFNNLIISPSSRSSIYEDNTHTSYAALQKTEQFQLFQSITHHRWLAFIFHVCLFSFWSPFVFRPWQYWSQFIILLWFGNKVTNYTFIAENVMK